MRPACGRCIKLGIECTYDRSLESRRLDRNRGVAASGKPSRSLTESESSPVVSKSVTEYKDQLFHLPTQQVVPFVETPWTMHSPISMHSSTPDTLMLQHALHSPMHMYQSQQPMQMQHMMYHTPRYQYPQFVPNTSPSALHNSAVAYGSPRRNIMPIESVSAMHKSLTSQPIPTPASKSTEDTTHSRFESYFAMREYFDNRKLTKGGQLDPKYFTDVLQIACDLMSNVNLLHIPTFLHDTFQYGDGLLACVLAYGVIVVDGATSLERYQSATNYQTTVALARRALLHIQQQFAVLTRDSRAQLVTVLCAIGLSYFLLLFNRGNAMSERLFVLAVQMVTEIDYSQLDAIHQQVLVRAKWLLYAIERSGHVQKRAMTEDIITNLVLPNPMAAFHATHPVIVAMPTMAQCIDNLEERVEELDVYSLVLLTFRLQDLLPTTDRAWMMQAFRIVEARLNGVIPSVTLASNDLHDYHPSTALAQLHLTWSYLYLPPSMQQLISDTWANQNPQDFASSLEHIGSSIRCMQTVVKMIDFALGSSLPVWSYAVMAKTALIFIALVRNVRQLTGEWVEDLVERTKVMLVGLRYAALSDRSLGPLCRILEQTIESSGSDDFDLTRLLCDTFPLLPARHLTPELVHLALSTMQGPTLADDECEANPGVFDLDLFAQVRAAS